MHIIKVVGMSCAHCVGSVEAAVLKADTEAKVEVDLAAGEVRVDSSAPVSAFTQAIELAGYTVAG